MIFKIVNILLAICKDSQEATDVAVHSFIEFDGLEIIPPTMSAIIFDLNEAAWESLNLQTDPKLLVDLLLFWIISLKVTFPHLESFAI